MPLRLLGHDLLKSQALVTNIPAIPTASNPDACLLPEPDYFDTIDQLIAWEGENISQHDSGTALAAVDDVAAQTSEHVTCSASRDPSKLLICHDFKGGYTENFFERGYSLEFWHLVDTFIYFSHRRVTLPPRGWVDAGHRHGSKVLGTVIFEWKESKPDLDKCLYGHLPQAPVSDVKHGIETLLFSTVCASKLIELAKDRGFDGYLINIETDLNFLPPASCYPGDSLQERHEDAAFMEREQNLAGLEALICSNVQRRRKQRMAKNASVLSSWVRWLRAQGKRLVGPHWEVIWYDSVTTDGELRWQDALTSANAPFFKNSDGILTNYTWARPPDPVPPGGLGLPQPSSEHHPALLRSALMAKALGRSSADVYMGIDVFGRNCYGGYEVGRSLDLIFPSHNREYTKELDTSDSRTHAPDDRGDLGLSVALFAPGWTWEREKEGGGERSWSEWWEDELRFWFGRTTITESSHGSNGEGHAVNRYFGPRVRHLSLLSSSGSRPNSSLELMDSGVSHPANDSLPKESGTDAQRTASTAFYTNFNCGSGCSWWVYGRKVYDASFGWTDIGSCFPKPDRIWPWLAPLYLDNQNTTGVHMLDRVSRGKWMVGHAGIIDYEAWQGGSSLEILFRPKHDAGPGADVSIHKPIAHLTVLTLCTLNTCHIGSHPLTVSLEIVVKPSGNPAGSLDVRALQLRPYLIWASNQLSEECSYFVPLSSSDVTTFCQLANGWYSCRAKLHLNDMDAMQLATSGAVVPVVALGVHLPRVLPPENLRLLVGEILLSAHPPSQLAPVPVSSLLTATAVTRSSTGTLRWKRVPAPIAASPTSLWGILTWHEDGTKSGDGNESLSSSGYFNIFAFVPKPAKTSEGNRDSDAINECQMWLGTSTYEHHSHSFVVAGFEPSDLISGSNRSIELTLIAFRIHHIGVAGRAETVNTEGWEPSYCMEGNQELEVSLL